MSAIYLVWKNVWRRKLRALFTLGSIIMAFALFGLLMAVKAAFGGGVELAGVDRLVMINKVSLIQPLPLAYKGRIAATPGVKEVTHASWFGGYYQEEKNFFPQFPVEPEQYLNMFPELLLPEDQARTWFRDREGAVIGRAIANQYGFKVGDRVPITSPIWRKSDGSSIWEFNVDGIYDGKEKGTDTTALLFHYDYYDEARTRGKGLVGWYTIRITDPDRAASIAKSIDLNFENSPYETKTSTEQVFAQGFTDQIGNIGKIVQMISTAVFFIILLVAGNTMAQSVRERTNEIAVLKTLGFSSIRVLFMVLGESFFIALTGAAVGMLLAGAMVSGVAVALARFFPIFYLPSDAFVIGSAVALGLGLVAGVVPAVQAMRLPIAVALRRA